MNLINHEELKLCRTSQNKPKNKFSMNNENEALQAKTK